MNYRVLSLVLLLVLVSCGGNVTKKYVERWSNKDINIGEEVVFICSDKDTVSFDEYKNAKTKMFVFVDSVGCTSCKLRLRDLIMFDDYLKNDLKINVPILLYFENNNTGKVSRLLKTHGYDKPICVDKNGFLSKKYEFSRSLTYNSFLLDSLNRVILVGYPMHNRVIEKMYVDEILRRR